MSKYSMIDNAEDADEILDKLDEAHYSRLLSSNSATPNQVTYLRAKKKFQNELSLAFQLLKHTHASSPSRLSLVLNISSLLENLNRREEAILLLKKNKKLGLGATQLSRGKLLFKASRLSEAFRVVKSVYSDCECDCDSSDDDASDIDSVAEIDKTVSTEDCADAYVLNGWIAIHNDDHCTAYSTWMAGYAALPSDARLKKQALKRFCWDGNFDDDDDDGDEPSQNLPSLQAFRARTCPAQALFPSQSQNRNLVFKTQAPILTNIECEKTLKIVKHYIETVNNGDWGTVRSATVKTTDVAVEDIPELRPWLRILLRDKIYPLCERAFPVLADGSDNRADRIRVHDAFIVRYDESDGSLSLPEHSDTSAISLTVGLNSSDEFEGGGTWFEALGENGDDGGEVVDGDTGKAVLFAGPLRHAGYPISSGTRIILVLFLYIEDFAYGKYIQRWKNCEEGEGEGEGETKKKNNKSGMEDGGFVVYRQTTELANMLTKTNHHEQD